MYYKKMKKNNVLNTLYCLGTYNIHWHREHDKLGGTQGCHNHG